MAEASVHTIISGCGPTVTRKTPCLFGVSVSSNAAYVSELKLGWIWTKSHFDSYSVLLGDSLYRISLQIERGLDPEASESAAALRAREIEAELFACLGADLPLIRTSAVTRRSRFTERLAVFTEAFDRRDDFRAALTVDARRYCERQARRDRLRVSFDASLGLATAYLLEEMAVYDLLAHDGWLAEAYQGDELEVLRLFMLGAFPGLAPDLANRTHFSLKTPRVRRMA